MKCLGAAPIPSAGRWSNPNIANPMPQTLIADVSTRPCLAVLPTQGDYFNIFYIVLFFVLTVLWAYSAAWAQADGKKTRMSRGLWVPSIFASGLCGLVIWLFIPMYWIGFGLFTALYGTIIIIYVVVRNRRVSPAQTVLTMAHIQRLISGGKAKGPDKTHAQDRARIKDHEGKTPAWPKDPEQHAGYQGLQDLLFDAIWRRTSDVRLDFVPQQPVKVIYKVDGVDRLREPIAPELGPSLLAHFKRIAGLDVEEHRRPQSGGFEAAIGAGGQGDKEVEVGVKTSGSTAGQRVLLKITAEESKFRTADIGMTSDQLPVFEKLVKKSRGVMICGGPRASGVTSTLYAILRSHDVFMQNIHTLEIVKSLDIENITQHVYDGQESGVTFGKRFRSILRSDPDIVLAGDTPDAETAQYAAAAVKEGKKIYLGMTAKDTFSALRRYLQGVGNNGLAAAGLLAITCQRLVRILCTECRRAYKPDPALLKKANLPTGENRPFYRPPNPNEIEADKHGNQLLCPVCQGSGYLGRTGVFELLLMDDHLRALIAKGTALPTVKAEARKRGMLYLQEVALHKVYEGITSINEVLRVTKESSSKPAPPSRAGAS